MGAEERLEFLEREIELHKHRLPMVRFSGFFQLDSIQFSQSRNNQATVGDIQSGSGFRRLRLIALGNLAEFTAFDIELEFAAAGRPVSSTFGASKLICLCLERSASANSDSP